MKGTLTMTVPIKHTIRFPILTALQMDYHFVDRQEFENRKVLGLILCASMCTKESTSIVHVTVLLVVL